MTIGDDGAATRQQYGYEEDMNDIQNIDFLRNDFEGVGLIMAGMTYSSVEHAYQAAKTSDKSLREKIAAASAQKAKKIGRKVPLIPEWKSKRLAIMETLVRQKFFVDEDLQDKLIETGTAPLMMVRDEDTFWGCAESGEGLNHLGKILEKIRAEAQLIRGWSDQVIVPLSDDPDIQLVLDQAAKVIGVFRGSDIEHEDLFRLLCVSSHAPFIGDWSLDKYRLSRAIMDLETAWVNFTAPEPSEEDDQE